MKVGDLVLSKHPRIYGEGFGVVVGILRPPSIIGGRRPPRYYIHWLDTDHTGSSIPGIELRKVA